MITVITIIANIMGYFIIHTTVLFILSHLFLAEVNSILKKTKLRDGFLFKAKNLVNTDVETNRFHKTLLYTIFIIYS